MIATLEAVFDGQTLRPETRLDLKPNTRVRLVMETIESDGISLQSQNITSEQAAELRASLATFQDWNAPEMDIYNDYDAAKASS